MENEINMERTQVPERPMFLTVLCILTFIGSGWVLLSELIGLLGSSALDFLPGGSKEAPNTTAMILGILAALLCLLGAIRMWSLHKDGFWAYVLGAILSIVGAFIGFSSAGPMLHHSLQEHASSLSPKAKSITEGAAMAFIWIGLAFAIIINVVFVILYGINKKHLVK